LTGEFSSEGRADARRGTRDEDRVAGKRWQRPPNGALWILENDGLVGVGDGGLGLADRVAVVALGLGVLVVGFGLGQELLGFVDELPRLGAHLARLGLLDRVFRLLDHDRAGIRPGSRTEEDERCGYEQDDEKSHAGILT